MLGYHRASKVGEHNMQNLDHWHSSRANTCIGGVLKDPRRIWNSMDTMA